MNSAAKEHSIFLSYARQDEPWVAEFAEALHAAGIHDYWLDRVTMSSADALIDQAETALRESDTLVVFFSPNSLNNPTVFFELGAALAGEKQIIPVLIGNVEQEQIPFSLAQRQWLRATSPAETATRVAEIIKQSA